MELPALATAVVCSSSISAERLGAERIEHFLGQLVLLLLQRDQFVEVLAVALELFVDLDHLLVALRVLDLVETLLDFGGHLLLVLAAPVRSALRHPDSEILRRNAEARRSPDRRRGRCRPP